VNERVVDATQAASSSAFPFFPLLILYPIPSCRLHLFSLLLFSLLDQPTS
jgi:hypothetical protein